MHIHTKTYVCLVTHENVCLVKHENVCMRAYNVRMCLRRYVYACAYLQVCECFSLFVSPIITANCVLPIIYKW